MKTVKIYTTKNCKYCVDAKKYFDDNKIAYTSIDVSDSVSDRKDMIEISGQMGVPVIVVDNDVVIGFQKAKLANLLDIK